MLCYKTEKELLQSAHSLYKMTLVMSWVKLLFFFKHLFRIKKRKTDYYSFFVLKTNFFLILYSKNWKTDLLFFLFFAIPEYFLVFIESVLFTLWSVYHWILILEMDIKNQEMSGHLIFVLKYRNQNLNTKHFSF